MSPLRQQLIDEMAVRRFSPKTHASYLRWVKDSIYYLRTCPLIYSPMNRLVRIYVRSPQSGA
ncbi:hypothetical protein [Vibrio sp. ED004]|uniref:hypothetical protein n=1 Tax=Vibrio sp. ED004 TaxID=2785124 RepID=UPI0020BF1FA7|nr:hypothetical protein [Vibrio sp. ED004]